MDLLVHFSDGTDLYDSADPQAVSDFYQRLKTSDNLPTTSQPQPAAYYELMDQLVLEDYEVVYAIHLSAGISGTYQTSYMILNEYQDRLDVHCIDSKGAGIMVELLVRSLLEMLAAGVDPAVAAQELVYQADQSEVYLMVEDLNNLAKGGRLSNTGAVLGSLLRVRPLLKFDEAGKIVLFEKIRTNKRVYQRWLELARDFQDRHEQGLTIGFLSANDSEGIEEVRHLFQEEFPEVATYVGICGPVIGTHVGEGCKAVGFIPRPRVH